MEIPAYVESRLRRPIPRNSGIVPGSTPVISFGNPQSAAVATLGINPSRIEFLDKHGAELVGDGRRLATLRSLGVKQLFEAPTSVLSQVVADCNGYFQKKPYCRWFNQLEPILNSCAASYYDGTACHLDLVQWATNPIWGKLERTLRNRLLQDDAAFLAEQLRNENIRLLVVNGNGALKKLRQGIMADLKEAEPIVGFGRQSTRLYVGTFHKAKVVGYSTNLQSSHGVTGALRVELAKRVALLAN